MESQIITAVFDRLGEAESAVGRLEVAGIPAGDINVHRLDDAYAGRPVAVRTIVTASVEARLIDKAMGILTGDGRLKI